MCLYKKKKLSFHEETFEISEQKAKPAQILPGFRFY